METPTNIGRLPEAMLTEILVKLTLRSIFRFKSVCKAWKTTLESVYFRRHFLSLHKNSSSSWSLIRGEKELMGFYGCEAWELPKSPASYIPPPCNLSNHSYFGSSSSSNGLVLMDGSGYYYFVGNPLLHQWAKIHIPPYQTCRFGLVTRVDEDGVVLSFKIVRRGTTECTSTCLLVHIYSSETGIWTSKKLQMPFHISYVSMMSLNETIYILSRTEFELREPEALIAHNFYSESDQCQVIPLPDRYNNNRNFKRALTTCRGFVMYIKTLAQEVDGDILKVWRLENDSANWQLLWDIQLPFMRSDIGYYAPMAMHPFDTDIVYLWSQQSHHLVSCNLRTLNYKHLRDASKWYKDDDGRNCFMNRSICQKYMDEIWGAGSLSDFSVVYGYAVALSQFVLPRWMESVPCPPQVEMINTTALLSYMSLMQKRHKRKRDNGGKGYWIQ